MADDVTAAQGDRDTLERLVRQFLVALGENPDREGLKDTPRRVAAFWHSFLHPQPENLDVTFEVYTADQLVVVSCKSYSVCEHHLLPFSFRAWVGYLARGRVVGLSKIIRLVHQCSHKLQLQERLAQEIADGLSDLSGSPDVGVVIVGQHLCCLMRGVRTEHRFYTSVLRGELREDPALRGEFLSLVGYG